MMQVFRWPSCGPHQDRFLVIVHSAIWHALDRLTVSAAVVPFVQIETFDPHAIINAFGEVNVFSGNAKKSSADDDNPELAFKLALNRAIRKALEAQGLFDVWNEIYHTKQRRPGMRLYRLASCEPYTVLDHDNRPARIPNCKTYFDQLERIPLHAAAQHATVILDLGFRKYLELHYGKTNCVDGRMGWTMVYTQPKPDYEGEPDDFKIAERVFPDGDTAAYAFTLRAKTLLNIAR